MPNFIDLTDKQFGRLTVLRSLGRVPIGKTGSDLIWECSCECGKQVKVGGNSLRTGNTSSCGCLRKEAAKARRTTHGLSGKSRAHKIWKGMLQRCRNPLDAAFKHYGGRGIGVCKRWFKFENFYADMGEPPDGYEIERKENDKGYSPDNCKWATRKEQVNNTRRNRVITFKGVKQTLSQWAEQLGINDSSLAERLERGWPLERALTVGRTK